MDSRELREWMAYEAATGPLGPRRGDWHAAIVAAAILNAMRGKKGRAITPEQLLPWRLPDEERKPEQTPEQMLRAIKSANRKLGGREVRHGDAAGPRDPGADQA